MENQSNWMTADEAAGYLRVKPATLLLSARQGKVQSRVLSGTLDEELGGSRKDAWATVSFQEVLAPTEDKKTFSPESAGLEGLRRLRRHSIRAGGEK